MHQPSARCILFSDKVGFPIYRTKPFFLFIHKDSEIFNKREGEEDDRLTVKAAKSDAQMAEMALLSPHSFLSALPSSSDYSLAIMFMVAVTRQMITAHSHTLDPIS